MESRTKNSLTRTLVKGHLSYIRDDQTVAQAAKRLASENIGALPVCDRNIRLVGMITDRDIVVSVVARGKNPTLTLVREAAHREPVVVGGDETLEAATELMAEHQVRRLPVVEGRSCIGIITQADIARALPDDVTGKMVSRISADSAIL